MAQALEYFQRLGRPIFSPATSLGGPVCVIRVSGPDLSDINKIVGGGLPSPGQFSLKKIVSLDGRILDQALVLNFQSPKSFTGENVVEIQCHGSLGIVNSVILELGQLGFLNALPGEFSFRAVVNGQMTLEGAEKLNFNLTREKIDTNPSEKLLSDDASGKSKTEIQKIWEELLIDIQKARGRVEAAIDFPEAEEEQSEELKTAHELLVKTEAKFNFFLDIYFALSRGSQESRVLILGPPNAGKSTLLNILSGVDSAIVSSIPGTTRDLVEIRVQGKNNSWIRFIDSAGLRPNSNDPLEIEGMSRAAEALARVHGVVWVEPSLSLSDKQLLVDDMCFDRKMFLEKAALQIQRLLGDSSGDNKFSQLQSLLMFSHWDEDSRSGNISSDRPQGVFNFKEEKSQIRELVLSWIHSIETEKPVPKDIFVSKRQAGLLEDGKKYLSFALEALNGKRPLELAANDLRECEAIVLRARGKDLGDEYIGQIFSQFCLGK